MRLRRRAPSGSNEPRAEGPWDAQRPSAALRSSWVSVGHRGPHVENGVRASDRTSLLKNANVARVFSLRPFGYRIETPEKSIVISGDAKPSPGVIENCNGCDLLIHEVYTEGSTKKVQLEWQKYRLSYHTSSTELADIAAKTKPGLLVLYHRANPGCDQVGAQCGNSGSEEELLQEIREHYTGRVVAAHDMDIY